MKHSWEHWLEEDDDWESEEHGRELAKTNNFDFIIGCMLYWAEGGKTTRQTAAFVNSDVDMVKKFVDFIRKFYVVKRIKIKINCHLDYGWTYEQVRDFWSSTLRISINDFGKPQIHNGVPRTKGCHQRLQYGTCSVVINDVKVVQSIFGGIQEIAGIERKNWLG
jgi:hypothetical protein